MNLKHKPLICMKKNHIQQIWRELFARCIMLFSMVEISGRSKGHIESKDATDEIKKERCYK